MFPMELDQQILSNLPLPNEHSTRRVLDVLNGIFTQSIVPYFRNKRGTDLIQLAAIKQRLSVSRMEDENNRIKLVSIITRSGNSWTMQVHERLFDYLAFVLPLKPELAMTNRNTEERMILVFAEFMLRHNFEHMLYPQRQEQEVIKSDINFALAWREEDPTAYRMLRSALANEMNGLKGDHYLDLLDHTEKGKTYDCTISRMINTYTNALTDLPKASLEAVFENLETRIQAKILGNYYRKSRSTSYTLFNRAASLQELLELLALLIQKDPKKARAVLSSFKDRWGLIALLHELNLPETATEDKNIEEILDMLRSRIKDGKMETLDKAPSATPPQPPPAPRSITPPQPAKSIKERIEEAKNDPYFPQAVMELIDKNKLNASGQSGAKYQELIEILLAIPWGRIQRISVTPSEFEGGLNRSHYGLRKPKELISDFFSNLIWRYQHFKDSERRSWKKTGSALLFVGPPGVGKTSLAISIARNLGIPYHKISLGGMKDEADIRGYGFTYEGSKPGPIVQGLIKMGAMNGMFILDEVDKTEKFAIATLLEILDPEQNHMFHDKYTQSTIDIDLSNAHFVLTANTLETVPPPVLDRCEVIVLNRYSVDEKMEIAREHLINKLREKYMIGNDEIYFDPFKESELLRYLIKNYTFEAGVRDLERVIRTLFLRIHRKEVLTGGKNTVRITKDKIKEHLEEPARPRQINEDDRIGEMMGLGVNMELGIGSLIPIQATQVRTSKLKSGGSQGYTSIVQATGNLEKVMDESRKVASTAIAHRSDELGIEMDRLEDSIHLHFMGASTKKDGPSAGGAIALALASLFLGRRLRRDVTMTGEIDTQGRITGIGGLAVKLETAYSAGCKTMIIPKENLHGEGGIGYLPDGLKEELQILTYDEWKGKHENFDHSKHVMQVIAVDDILQAADIAFIDDKEIDGLEEMFREHALLASSQLANGEDNGAFRRLRLIYVEEPNELDPEFFNSDFCEEDHGCVLLVNPESRESILARLPGWEKRMKVRDFDPAHETFAEVIEDIREPLMKSQSRPLRISIIAPLVFLRKEGIRMEDFPADSDFIGLRLFSSCCTVENVQIKDCRKLLNRAYRQLVRMDDETIEEGPFILKKDGIYVVSLSFIPEKYRLDPKRAEGILKQCLIQWMEILEQSAETHKEPVPVNIKLVRSH